MGSTASIEREPTDDELIELVNEIIETSREAQTNTTPTQTIDIDKQKLDDDIRCLQKEIKSLNHRILLRELKEEIKHRKFRKQYKSLEVINKYIKKTNKT